MSAKRINIWPLFNDVALVVQALMLLWGCQQMQRLHSMQSAHTNSTAKPLAEGRANSVRHGQRDPRQVAAPIVVLEQRLSGGLLARFPDGSSRTVSRSSANDLSSDIIRAHQQVVVRLADQEMITALRVLEANAVTVMVDLNQIDDQPKEATIR